MIYLLNILIFVCSLWNAEQKFDIAINNSKVGAISSVRVDNEQLSFVLSDDETTVLFYTTDVDTFNVATIQSNNHRFTIDPIPENCKTIYLFIEPTNRVESCMQINISGYGKQNVSICLFIILIVIVLFVIILVILFFHIRGVRCRREIQNNANIKAQELQLRNEELQKINATQNKFYSIIAHDLKSPLNALIGFTDLLIEKYDDLTNEKRLRYITIVNRSSKSMYDMLVNLLDWSRSQSGCIRYEPNVFSIDKLVRIATEYNQYNAERKNIEIVNTVPKNLSVYVDYNMMIIALRNVISNAVKYSRHDEKIEISAQLINQMVAISVKDSGIGMTDEQINKILVDEHCESTPGTDAEQGTGLGLALCRDFVKQMHGRIEIQSVPGVNSIITMFVPCK